MLIKCVCASCGHSYLSDDEAGDVACPRCDAVGGDDLAPRHGLDTPADPLGVDTGWDELPAEDDFTPMPGRFEAKAPPAMYLTWERLFRGVVFGLFATATAGVLLGAALAALGMDAPAVLAIAIGVVAGATCRSGFGGRTARHSSSRAAAACIIVVLFGFAGFSAGTWVVERLTSARVTQAQKELDAGLQGLSLQYSEVEDAGAAIVLKARIEETRRLRALSSGELEDYLWMQQAQINNPMLAHAKLRVTTAPIVRLGPDRKPIRVRMEATMGIRIAELLIAILLAARFVKSR